nr:ATP synthase subunit 8 [Thasus neocalifornicus]
MPQMAPLSWEILYITFLMLLTMMCTLMFYTKLTLPKPLLMNQISTNQANWKW